MLGLLWIARHEDYESMGILCVDAIRSEGHARAGNVGEIVVLIHTSMVSNRQVARNSHTSVSQATAGLRMKIPRGQSTVFV